jgi:hypothetical protein
MDCRKKDGCSHSEGKMSRTPPSPADDFDAQIAALAATAEEPATVAGEAKIRKAREMKNGPKKPDGRMLKATGRTVQFNIKMKPELKERIADVSYRHGLAVTAFIEQAAEAFIAKLEGKGGKHA